MQGRLSGAGGVGVRAHFQQRRGDPVETVLGRDDQRGGADGGRVVDWRAGGHQELGRGRGPVPGGEQQRREAALLDPDGALGLAEALLAAQQDMPA